MPLVACPSCQNRFPVEEGPTVRRSNCPRCGREATRPALPTPSHLDEAATLPPLRADEPSESPTLAPPSNPDATLGAGTRAEIGDPSLTEFLSPPQAADELGRMGKYRILAILGHGGMGVVYRAEDPKLKRGVAIKAMLPSLAASADAGKRFLREAQAMAAVEHDHIVRIYQVDEEAGVPFLAMEFLKGEPLDKRLERDGKLLVGEVLRIGREIAEGLAAAHATGLIHRDVKPANVWLEAPNNRVKILDFGLARAASPDSGVLQPDAAEQTQVAGVTGADQDASLTQEGAIVGTPAYMAPEQAGGAKVDARCDLFSLGCVLYRMCTGKQPFQGPDVMTTLIAVATHQPAPPAQLNPLMPRELSDLVMRLLEKQPGRRPRSAAEVAEGLRKCEARLEPRKRLPWIMAVSAALVLVALIGAATFALFRASGGEYVIDTDQPELSFRVSRGAVELRDRKTGRDYPLRVVRQDGAEHEVEAAGSDGELVFEERPFVVRRGEQAELGTWLQRRAAVEEAWRRRAAALSPDEQVGLFSTRMKELNPGFDGKVTHKVEDGAVTEIRFVTDKVTNVSPLRAFDKLRVLECSGTATNSRVNGKLADLSPLAGMDLKELKFLSLNHNNVGDSDLAPFVGCEKLTHLYLGGTKVTDAGLAPFARCKDLSTLWLFGTQVGDAGLAHFRGCDKLADVHLAHSKVGDAGVAHLAGKRLTSLDLDYTQVTDKGLAHLAGWKGFSRLNLNATKVTDDGLAHLAGQKGLTGLGLSWTQVSSAGLAHFRQCKELSQLNLTSTQVDSAGFAHLAGCKKMTTLGLAGTKVRDLSPLKGMPLKDLSCEFEPERDLDILRTIATLETINGRPANEFIAEAEARLKAPRQMKAFIAQMRKLNPGFDGTVTHKVEDGVVTELRFLTDKVTDISPLRAFDALRVLDCSGTPGNGQLADLTPLKGMNLANLTQLTLYWTKVGDAGMAFFKDCKSLTDLKLGGTQVGDAGMAFFKDCKSLTYLDLGYTQVGDAGVAHFKGCNNLTRLSVGITKVGDAGLAIFKDCKNLTDLHIQNTQMSNAGLAHFKDCKSLTLLNVSGTTVTDLSPLKGMPLETLACQGTKVRDLSSLRGMPLNFLICDFVPERDADILRSIKTLETINYKPAKEFWKAVPDDDPEPPKRKPRPKKYNDPLRG